MNHIEKINNRLAHPNLPIIEHKALEYELSKTSKLLDYSEQFVPRPSPPLVSIELTTHKGPDF